MSNGICFNKVAQLNTLQLLTKLSQRTVGTQIVIQLVQVVQLHTNPGDLQHRNVNDVKINLTPEISVQLKMLNATNAKRKDISVVSALPPLSKRSYLQQKLDHQMKKT